MHEWGVDPDVLLSDTRILDVLLHNSDRHHGRLGSSCELQTGAACEWMGPRAASHLLVNACCTTPTAATVGLWASSSGRLRLQPLLLLQEQ